MCKFVTPLFEILRSFGVFISAKCCGSFNKFNTFFLWSLDLASFFVNGFFYTDHGKPFPDSQTSYYSLFEFLIHLSVNIFDFDKIEAQNQRLLDLRKKAVAEQKRVLRDQRKAVLKEKKERSEAEALKSAVKVSLQPIVGTR